MTEIKTDRGHGEQGKRAEDFTNLKQLRSTGYDMHKLATLAAAMSMDVGDAANDGPDAEENLYVPAGYTYLGQFVDHDLTFDSTSSLDPTLIKSNERTPRFDLDSLYGSGPSDRPYMYDSDGVTLLYGGKGQHSDLDTPWDLLRSSNGRAIIGDKRNDENSIINQLHMMFLKFHNKVALELKVTRQLAGSALFEATRDEVRWAYQRILVDDFLPRIISGDVLNTFVNAWTVDSTTAFLWYRNNPDIRSNLPREFVAAAYRFGHSGVRTGYRLNGNPGPNNGFVQLIFDAENTPKTSLIGFDPLPKSHIIDDWGRFFPVGDPRPGTGFPQNEGTTVQFLAGGEGSVRLQYAYKLDTTLVDPLASLPTKIADPADVPLGVGPEYRTDKPSLALLNLLRGNIYRIASGQTFAKDVGGSLPIEDIVVRKKIDTGFEYVRVRDLADGKGNVIGDVFDNETPLWFYILAEAQQPLVNLWRKKKTSGLPFDDNDLLGNGVDVAIAHKPNPGAGTQLGPVGGRLVAEVFYGILESDPKSFVNAAPGNWSPIWGSGGPATMAQLIAYTNLTIT